MTKTNCKSLEQFLAQYKKGYIRHIITSAKQVDEWKQEHKNDEDWSYYLYRTFPKQTIDWCDSQLHRPMGRRFGYDRRCRILKIVNREVNAKREKFIAKVEKIVGEITETSCLLINEDGSLNGYVEGTKGRAMVQTISAGGYRIQCLHYRVLVKKL